MALLRVVLVAAVAARPHGVRGTPAADVRRYVAMDTTMTDVSTVMRSMPTPPSDARIQASMTIPLSKTRSRASRKLVRSAVRSTGIAHSGSFRRSSYRGPERCRHRRQKGNRSPPPCRWSRRSAGCGLRGARRRRSRCTCRRRRHGLLSSTRSRTSTMLLGTMPCTSVYGYSFPSVTAAREKQVARCNVGA